MKFYGWAMRILCIAFVVSIGLYLFRGSIIHLALAGVIFIFGMITYGLNNEPKASEKSAKVVLTSLIWPVVILMYWFSFDKEPEFLGHCHLCNSLLKKVEVTTFLCPIVNTCVDDTEMFFEDVKYCPKCENKPKKGKVLCVNSKCPNFADCEHGKRLVELPTLEQVEAMEVFNSNRPVGGQGEEPPEL